MAFHRVPYISGNTAGRDHVNFATITPTEWAQILSDGGYTSSRDFRRIGLDAGTGCAISSLIATAWRVKKWKVTGNFTIILDAGSVYQGDGGGARTFTGTLNEPGDPAMPKETDGLITRQFSSGVGGPTLAEEEWQMVSSVNGRTYVPPPPLGSSNPLSYAPWALNPYTFYSQGRRFPLTLAKKFWYEHTDFRLITTYYAGPPGVYGPGSSIITVSSTGPGGPASDGAVLRQTDVGGLQGYNFYGNLVVYDPATKRFYPQVSCGMGINQGAANAAFVIQMASVMDTPNGFLTVDPVVAPSWKVPVLMWQPPEAPDFAPVSTSGGVVTLAMTAIEFWPFQNRLGQPVYDTETGAQLNDPFS